MSTRNRKEMKSNTNGLGMGLAPLAPATSLAPAQYREPTEITTRAPKPSDGWLARRRTRQMTASVELGTESLRAMNEYAKAANLLEQTRQEAERLFAQQDLLPVLMEVDRQKALAKVADGYAARERSQDQLDAQRRDAANRREIEEIRHETARLQALAELRQAEVLERRAGELGDRSVDTILARGNADRHRYVAESADYLAHARAQGGPVAAEPPPTIVDPTPEAYGRRLEAESQVTLVERRAEQDLAEIEGRRIAEGRDYYTAEEIERRDAIKNASASAVSDVRRGGASDVRPRKGG